jgi:type I restriction enzyme S subunit
VWNDVPFCKCSEMDAKKYALQNGDIVFARTGSVGNTGFIFNPPEGAVFASYLIRIRPNPKFINSLYLSFYFQTEHYWRQIEASKSGAIQGGLNATKLKELLVPLVSIPEQRRIAAILAKADRLRRLRRYALELGETFLQSVFVEMFGDIEKNSKGWKLAYIDDVVAFSQYGTSNKSNTERRGYPVLGMANIT